MVYSQINDISSKRDNFRGENIMLSTSTSNSSFLNNGNGTASFDFAENDDRIQILDCENTRTYQEPMSQTRRICFFASIAATVLVVIVFLLLPCESNCVAKSQDFMKTRNWIKSFEKIELKGDIYTMSLTATSPKNLVFMYRPDKIFPDLNASAKKNKQNGGVMSLSGSSGEIKWSREMNFEPRTMDCTLIDCDKSGSKDCLVMDDRGQVACFDSTGHFQYYSINKLASKLQRLDLLDFPLILPDLNGDKVNEILASWSNGKFNSTDLAIISGANGNVLMREAQNCSFLHKLELDDGFVVKFVCIRENGEQQQLFRNLTDLYSQISKKPLNMKKLQSASAINQHKYSGRRSTKVTHTSITEVEDKKLTIENSGNWPRDSKATITLTGLVKGVKSTLYNRTYNKVYAMVPVPLSLNSSSRNNENIHGFVIKLFFWNGTEISYNLERSRKMKRDMKSQRSNYTNQTFTSNPAYKTKVLYIKESIMLLVFNSTNMKVENTSQSNIVQFCQKTTGKDKKNLSSVDSICQPDLNQENSVLIADIDGDGSKELVSYYSTFVNDNDSKDITSDKWKLKTFVQLFKLENELPKLYADLDIY